MSQPKSCRATQAPVDVVDVGKIEYLDAWDRQRALANARADGNGPDTLLLLQHPPVYTAGKRTTDDERPHDGTQVIDVDRGGRLTWHGPGQLVGYPIIKLADPIDVVHYVRRLEQALIDVCGQYGLVTGRVDGRSGVWLAAGDGKPERKIAAIGIRVQRGVTMHGFAINCDNDLAPFDKGVPCGITGVGAASLSDELGRDVTVEEVLPRARDAVLAALDGSLPVREVWIDREAEPSAPGVTFALH